MRSIRAAALVACSSVVVALGVVPAWANSTLCVAATPGCFQTLAGALAAAPDGSLITMGAGVFDGGVTIKKNVSIVGAGAGRTIIRGGGPVITVGEFLGSRRLEVSISRVTVTGGVVTDHPASRYFYDKDGVLAAGGGIDVPPIAGDGPWYGGLAPGARLSLIDTVVTENRASASSFWVWDDECGHDCSFGWARGGGIDSWGDLNLLRSTVSDNVVDGLATDSTGGGIQQWAGGSVTLKDSVISGNKSLAVNAISRFAEGGGVMVDRDSDLTADRTVFRGNVVKLRSQLSGTDPWGNPWDMNANGGAVHVSDEGGHLTVRDSTFIGNSVDAADSDAQPVGFDSALHPGGSQMIVERTSFTDNSVRVLAQSSDWPGASGSVLDVNGSAVIRAINVSANTTTIVSSGGPVVGGGAVFVYGDGDTPARIVDSLIVGNTVTAKNPGGEVSVWGGGMLNAAKLDLRRTTIARNIAAGYGASGAVQGGGIWNASFYGSSPELSIDLSLVSNNVLTGSTGILRQGGGLYTTAPVTITRTVISRNSPSQCTADQGAPLPC